MSPGFATRAWRFCLRCRRKSRFAFQYSTGSISAKRPRSHAASARTYTTWHRRRLQKARRPLMHRPCS